MKGFLKVFTALLFIALTTPAFAGGGEKAAPPEGPYYKELPPIVVSLIDEGMVTDHITLVFVLEVKEHEQIAHVEKMYPLLQNEYVNYFHGLSNKRSRDGLNDAGFLKAKIRQLSNKVLGNAEVKDVLIKLQHSQSSRRYS